MNPDKRGLGIAAFVASLVLLALEVAHVRLLSYVADPRLVYAAIGIALTGMGGASIAIALRPSLTQGDVRARLSLLSSLFGLSVVGSSIVLALLGPGFSAASFGDVLVRALPLLLVCATPYFIGGLVLGIAVTASPAGLARTWSAGLIGSAIGCFVLYPGLRTIGLERELAAIALLAGVSAVALARSPRAIVVSLLLATAIPFAPSLMPFRPDPRDLLGLADAAYARTQPPALRTPPVRDAAWWDPMARVEIFTYPPPFGTLNDGVPIKLVVQDGGAGTILIGFGDHDDARRAWTERSVYATGYIAKPSPNRVLVIGLGGGVDVVTALQHGARDVTGVEINGSILEASSRTFAAFQGHVLSRPEVHLVHGDGRSFLEQAERRGEKWSLIQMSGADTYSAGTGGAFMFSESYLYTVDAFRRYFRALDDDGVLGLIRFGPEPLRAVISEAIALRQLGHRDLAKRFIVLRQGICFGILASKRPLDGADLERLRRSIDDSKKLSRVKLPMWDAMGFGIDEPLRVEHAPDAPGTTYAAALAAIEAGDRARLDAVLDPLPLDYAPTTDDRPFFFQFLKPRDWPKLASIGDRDFFASGLLGHARLLFAFVALAAVLTLLPLRAKGRPTIGAGPIVHFFLLGLAYMLIELVLMQRTVLLLGHPTASVSVTIASLLLGSGLGTLAIDRPFVSERPRRAVTIALAIAVALVALYEISFPTLVDKLLVAPTALRALGIAAIVIPLGAAMGVAFPLGLRAVSSRHGPIAAAWGLGVNGFASVLGSFTAVPAAMITGFRTLLFVAAALYVLAALTAPRER